jgi:hypothetical protein
MFSKLHERFGTAGLIVAILALVVALAGTAFAAAGLTSTQKKEVKKIAKQFAGKNGATGPAGPVGAPGAAGKDGAAGLNGTNGTAGQAGTTGPTGKTGPTGTTGATGQFELAALPTNATLKGTWSFHGTTGDTNGVLTNITFNVPLAAALDASHVHWAEEANFADFDEGGPGTIGCTGSAQDPTAPSGHLCVYKTVVASSTFQGILKLDLATPGASVPGAILGFSTSANGAIGAGSWAVTG